ncbi:MAG: M67 family metallopeptidase [Nitrospirae bacterium]|nr:M67 family metallopeptidase [Nitrospirota bacterium]
MRVRKVRGKHKIIIPSHLLDEVLSHCDVEYPDEACGILAGKEGVVLKVYKMKNIENSPISYLIDSKEQFTVMKEIRERGLDITAIYHSHPDLDAYPSAKDIQLAFYPESVYIIISLSEREREVKAFHIEEGNVKEVEIKVSLK